MDRPERYAIKIIFVLGVFVFLFLLFAAQAIKKQLEPNLKQRVRIETQRSPFNRQRAAKDLGAILSEAGPRPSGSPGAEITRAYIRKETARAGFALTEYSFESGALDRKVRCVTLVARVQGTREGAILVGTPLDTGFAGEKALLGANASGSGTAWLLEMARMWGPKREGRSLWLTWYDGTQTQGKGREFIEALRASGELDKVDAVINAAEIGDCFLGLAPDPAAPAWFRDCVWNMARDLAYDTHFSAIDTPLQPPAPIEPSFRACGMPCLDLLDYPFGGTVVQHNELWHTEKDTADRVCAESLQAVADVLYYALGPIEAQLDVWAREKRP